MNIRLDNEQKHFVVATGNSISCLEFEMVYEQAREIARRIKARSESSLLAKGLIALRNLLVPREDQIGTLEQYSQYQTLLTGYSKLEDNATWFDARTPEAVQRVLEDARLSGDVLRVFTGNPQSGRDWLDEYDTVGRIDRSTDWMKLPQLVAEGHSDGPTLLTDCIVRIIKVATGEECYRHPTYHLPKLELQDAPSYDRLDGYTHTVKVEGKDGTMDAHANFKSQDTAAHWVAFMNGLTHDFPVSQ